MTFANPRMLWLLAVTLPVLSWFLWWAWRKKQELIGQFVQSRLLADLTVGVSATLQKIRMLLLVLAVGLLLLTLARPQWGFVWEEARQQGLDIIVAIDTSRSMLAEDLSPNRLGRAKLAALDLMRLAKNDRLGLVAFAGTAFLQCPLTLDEEAFRQSVNTLEVGIIPQGGTALTEAIDAATRAFKEGGDHYKVLVLFTDGEDHESGAVEAAKKAADAGVRIFAIGVGTAKGEVLRQRQENGERSYVKDNEGNPVVSRLNEQLLTEVATTAHGFYLGMRGANTMDVLYREGLAPLPKAELSSKPVRRQKEQFQWMLALAIVVLLVETFLPDRKRVKKTAGLATTIAAGSPNAELRKAVTPLVILAGMIPLAAFADGARRKYDSGQFKAAELEYQKMLERKPSDPRVHFNAGAAAYRADDFEEAVRHFGAALHSPELDLQQQAYYNLGNTWYRVGERQSDVSQKMAAWEQSIRQFEGASQLNPQDADGKFNLEFVKKKLEELKKQQPPSQNQDKQNKDKQDNDKQDQSKSQDKKDSDQQKDQQEKKQNQSDQSKDKQQDKQPQDSSAQEQKPKDQGKQKDKQQQDQSDAQKQKPDQSKNSDRSTGQSEEKRDGESGEAAPAKAGQMTTEQVKRLLDSQKGEEKAMLFIPKEKSNSKNRVFKDW